MITPNPLYPGAKVALVCASSAVPEERLAPAVEAVRALGLQPVVYPSCYYENRHGYFAADDAQRAGDLQSAFADDTIAGVLAIRGGYGALRVALEKPEDFSCAFSISGALDVASSVKVVGTEDRPAPVNPYTGERKGPIDPVTVFGSGEVEGSDADLYALTQKRRAEGRPLPRLFQSVGTEDFIYPGNVTAHKKLAELGLDVTYEEHPGAHTWEYWDTHVQRALNWLPLAGSSVEE